MSEIAINPMTGKRVKIGTCSSMYYLRFEQRFDVQPLPGNVDPAKEADSLWFRLPDPDEDGTAPGEYDYRGPFGARPVPVFVPETVRGPDGRDIENPIWTKHRAELAEAEAGNIQLRTESGILVNAPCFHGIAKELPRGMFYNGHAAHQLAAFAVGVRNGAPVVLVGCRYCGRALFYYDVPEFRETFRPWGDFRERFASLLERLEGYAESLRAKRA